MGFIAIGLLTLLAVALLSLRRAVSERTIRWRLYAIRDELRNLAYKDRRLLDSPAFRKIDGGISAQCRILPEVSLWSLLPVIALDRSSREEVEHRQIVLAAELQKPENAEVSKLFHASVNLMIKHLLWRHMFLTFVAGLTLFGLLGIHICAKWASERIISGALTPLLQKPSNHIAHAA